MTSVEERIDHAELKDRLRTYTLLVNRKDLASGEVYHRWIELRPQIDALLTEHPALVKAAREAERESRYESDRLRQALHRLASQQGFVGAAYIDPASIAWRELQLRADYAKNVLKGGSP